MIIDAVSPGETVYKAVLGTAVDSLVGDQGIGVVFHSNGVFGVLTCHGCLNILKGNAVKLLCLAGDEIIGKGYAVI